MVIEFAATIFYPLYPTIEIQTVLSVTFFHKLQNCSHWLILLRRLKYVDFVVFFLFCSQHFTQIFIVISLVLIVIVCCYIFVVKNHLQYLPLACVLKMLFFNQLFAVLLASAIICLLFLVLAIVLRVTFFGRVIMQLNIIASPIYLIMPLKVESYAFSTFILIHCQLGEVYFWWEKK